MTNEMPRDLSHKEAMELIDGAASVTTLGYEEAIAIYLRARGILPDGEKILGAPIPKHWKPGKPLLSIAN